MALESKSETDTLHIECTSRRTTRNQKAQCDVVHEVVDMSVMNNALKEGQLILRDHITNGPRLRNGRLKCRNAVVQVRCQKVRKRNKWARYIHCTCSACGEILYETLSHQHVDVECNGKHHNLNGLDIRYVIAANAVSVKCFGLNLLQSILNLPLTPNSLFQKVDRIVSIQKKKQCKQEMDAQIYRILADRSEDYQLVRGGADLKQRYKCARAGFDGTWPNKQYARNSRNGCGAFMDGSPNNKKVIHFETRSKGHNYPIDGSSGNMEPEMLAAGIKHLQSKGIHLHEVHIDGDSKIPKLISALNKSNTAQNLPEIQIRPDIAHSKKSIPKKIYKFKSEYDWTDSQYQATGFTEKFTRVLTDAMFQYAFHDDSVNSVEGAKKALRTVFDHYLPDDADHTTCWEKQYTWCPTAFGNAQNHSAATGRSLPIGMRATFEKYIFEEVFTDKVIAYLIKPGCTSLVESLNHVINKFADKQRYLGAVSYEAAVCRGVLQWNRPLVHYKEELEAFGLTWSGEQEQWMKRMLQHRKYVHDWSHSHERYLEKHRKKYKLSKKPSSDYVGNCNGLND